MKVFRLPVFRPIHFSGRPYRWLTEFMVIFTVTLFFFSLLRTQKTDPYIREYKRNFEEAVVAFTFMDNQKRGQNSMSVTELYNRPVSEPSASWCFLRQPRKPSFTQTKREWQPVAPAPFEVYLYSATLDAQRNVSASSDIGAIQVLAVADQLKLARTGFVEFYCQIWSADGVGPMSIVKAELREIWIKAWDPRYEFYVPLLFSCPVPKKGSEELAYVSITARSCETATNLLPIRKQIPRPKNDRNSVAVCVKGLSFLDDISGKLVEWIEAHRTFGVSKIFIYYYAIHENIAKVLDYYSKEDNPLVDAIPLTLPGSAPQHVPFQQDFIGRNRQQKRRNELIPYNDCLYRSLGNYDWLLPIDTDELIVPVKTSNYPELLTSISEDFTLWTAISVRNAYFFDNLTTSKYGAEGRYPAAMHMLNHPVRTAKFSPDGSFGKAFVNVRNAVTMFNHFPLHKRLPVLKKTVYVAKELAIKHHYKSYCPVEEPEKCSLFFEKSVLDYGLLAYANLLSDRVQNVLNALRLG